MPSLHLVFGIAAVVVFSIAAWQKKSLTDLGLALLSLALLFV